MFLKFPVAVLAAMKYGIDITKCSVCKIGTLEWMATYVNIAKQGVHLVNAAKLLNRGSPRKPMKKCNKTLVKNQPSGRLIQQLINALKCIRITLRTSVSFLICKHELGRVWLRDWFLGWLRIRIVEYFDYLNNRIINIFFKLPPVTFYLALFTWLFLLALQIRSNSFARLI
ncbi:hypothetical protein QF004_001052 [Chryseobacterium sp. MDT2-18]|nr:hypothetical protein [Chryseobacterium sp. MDT2-18]